jgi:hypothetical protein
MNETDEHAFYCIKCLVEVGAVVSKKDKKQRAFALIKAEEILSRDK